MQSVKGSTCKLQSQKYLNSCQCCCSSLKQCCKTTASPMFELPEPHFTFSKKYLIQQHSIPANPSSAARTAAKVSAVLLLCFSAVSLKLPRDFSGVCACRSHSLRLICSKVNVGLAVCFTGRDETMQPAKPAKPSFLEYFEQKEKEANIHNDGGGKGQNNADNRKLPGEGDLEVVSWKRGAHCYTLP